MLKHSVIKGVLGVSAAALFAALTAQAQTTATDNGKPGATSQSTSGQGSTTSTRPGATGTPSTGTQSTGTQSTGTQSTGTQSTGTSTGTQSADTQSTGTAGSTASGSGMAGGKLAMSDQKILSTLAEESLAEIDAARIAQGKSQNDDVKKFAQQMIDDHTKMLDDVKQLAQTKGVTLPSDLDRMHKAKSEKLSAMSGSAFDRAYLSHAGVADHKKDHAMLQKAEAQAKDPDVKALLTRAMPIIDQHLAAVQQLSKSTARGSSKTTGNTGASPDKK